MRAEMAVNLRYKHYENGDSVYKLLLPGKDSIPHVTNSDTGKFTKTEKKVSDIGFTVLKMALPISTAYNFLQFGVTSVMAQTTESISTSGAVSGLGGLGERLLPIIRLVQDLALPVGIIMASWGVVEIIMGNVSSGKEKIKWAIIGYIGLFIVPEVFYLIRDGFRGTAQIVAPLVGMVLR